MNLEGNKYNICFMDRAILYYTVPEDFFINSMKIEIPRGDSVLIYTEILFYTFQVDHY